MSSPAGGVNGSGHQPLPSTWQLSSGEKTPEQPGAEQPGAEQPFVEQPGVGKAAPPHPELGCSDFLHPCCDRPQIPLFSLFT